MSWAFPTILVSMSLLIFLQKIKAWKFMKTLTSLKKTSICEIVGLFGSAASILGLAAVSGRNATLENKGFMAMHAR
ncbi:hypothetical protein B0E43_13545 [Algoriphagus sp. A40]|nr:hypothetical protein B0E43_13545 [Algoriphagus sp. A40]